ncbi:YlbD family protein [Metabacillus malikii]|uniref:Uncharacterized protein (UPF0305 family) n=1 Tax=Metabacillus malikii TaxID=1504265 RepID=A0ABT9ZG95_9BACI|nr:YlbD family protein [Metabacillus malikii]MDQ0231298.1 uncharacterized protein (UPF0305 family) [Metabacillus malikii]
MSTKKSNSSVDKFKEFVRKHPKLIQEVRKGNKKWQDVYEDWYLLGENDVIWKPYKEEQETETEEQKKDFMTQMVSAIKKMDMNEVNHHITNVSSTLATIQDLFNQFGGTKGPKQHQSGGNHQPFSFRKD